MADDQKTLGHFVEFESKYSVDPSMLTRFKMLVEDSCQVSRFLYCEGPDDYYVLPGTDRFKRFRHASFPPGCRKEITTKTKPEGAKNNINRREINLDVTASSDDTIRESIVEDGFQHSFSIWKACHIYDVPDATLVFYTVVDRTPGAKDNEAHFVEIEVDEGKIHGLTEDQAWEVIVKYEALLEPIGINAHKRLRKSLYEQYRRKP